MKYSFIIPVYNDQRIFSCLKSIEYSVVFLATSYEIIIISNGSSSEFLETLNKEIPLFDNGNIVFVVIKKRNIACARNIGIKSASGTHMIFIDSDCLLPTNYFQCLGKSIKLMVNSIIRGKVVFQSSNRINKLSARLRDLAYNKSKSIKMFAPNLIVPKEFFYKYGFFDEGLDYGVDAEWGQRMYFSGIYPIYDSTFFIYHFEDQTFRKTVKTWFKYGIGMAFRMKREFTTNHSIYLVFHGLQLWSQDLHGNKDDLIFSLFIVFHKIIYISGVVCGLFLNGRLISK